MLGSGFSIIAALFFHTSLTRALLYRDSSVVGEVGVLRGLGANIETDYLVSSRRAPFHLLATAGSLLISQF